MRSDSPCAAGVALGARPAPLGGRRDLLGCHNLPQRNHDVGLPRTDGARTGLARHQEAQRIGEPALDPVPHYHPSSGNGGGEETGGGGGRSTHHFILSGFTLGARLGSR
ncbi:hypothetical protein ARTHRO9AX_180480 [Arthrobacter sp. 9AX]|nr:hypothetical protein ARTHRO9AX_180480 [Arthrobacter sp. 9AX]